jgi:preprotein translocase subunit SecB
MSDRPNESGDVGGMAQPPADAPQPATNPPQVKRVHISTVTDLGLSLVRVQLTSVLCMIEQAEQLSLMPSVAEIKSEGKLSDGALTNSGFRAEVNWSINLPGAEKKPFSLAGKHAVVFSTTRPATPSDADYYSRVNAVILLHPYLRQLVEDLSAKCLGQSIMLKTLDVIDFVKKETDKFHERQSQVQAHEGE